MWSATCVVGYMCVPLEADLAKDILRKLDHFLEVTILVSRDILYGQGKMMGGSMG